MAKTKKTLSSSKKTKVKAKTATPKKTKVKAKTATPKKTKTKSKPQFKATTSSPMPTSAQPSNSNAGGAVVGGTDPCACGHAPEEHGRNADHPGSTSCVVCEDGDCVAYESDPGAID